MTTKLVDKIRNFRPNWKTVVDTRNRILDMRQPVMPSMDRYSAAQTRHAEGMTSSAEFPECLGRLDILTKCKQHGGIPFSTLTENTNPPSHTILWGLGEQLIPRLKYGHPSVGGPIVTDLRLSWKVTLLRIPEDNHRAWIPCWKVASQYDTAAMPACFNLASFSHDLKGRGSAWSEGLPRDYVKAMIALLAVNPVYGAKKHLHADDYRKLLDWVIATRKEWDSRSDR